MWGGGADLPVSRQLNNVLYLLYKTKVDTFSSEPLLNFIVVENLRIKLLLFNLFLCCFF